MGLIKESTHFILKRRVDRHALKKIGMTGPIFLAMGGGAGKKNNMTLHGLYV